MDCAFLGFAFLLTFYTPMLLLPVTLRLFCGFSYVFSSLHLVLRGREDVAHAVSRLSIFVFELWDLKNAQFFNRLRRFASL